MNKRLVAYLRSLGLANDADDNASWEFYRSLRGLQASIANSLNYNEDDAQGRTNCDLMIRALGYDPEKPSQLLGFVPGGGSGNRNQPGGDGASNLGDLERGHTQGVQAENQRVQAIRQFASVAGTPVELLRQLESDVSITADAARQRIFQEHAERTRAQNVPSDVPTGAPAGHSRNSQTDFNRDAITCALMLRNGVSDPTRTWVRHNESTGLTQRQDQSSNSEIMRAADRGQEIRRLSMVELTRRALELDGIKVEPDHVSIGRALQQRGAAAMSTSALVGIFTQTYGAIMLAAFETTKDTTQGWTIERENPNFLQNERHRMAHGAALTRHAKGGRAEDVEIEEALTEYVKIFRYSGIFTVDEIDLINDTFGALNEFTPTEMGEAARRIGPDLVYFILMNNPALADTVALFHATHGNLKTSAPLNKANLQIALTAVGTQRENGVNLNLEAKYLIVPKILKYDAKELVRSQTVIIAGDTNTVRPSANALVDDDLQVVSDSRLDNGVTDPLSGVTVAGDVNDWYVACPGSRHTIEKTHLRGSSHSPEMRSGILDRGQFGIWFDIHHDIGAKALAAQGMCKSTG